MAEEKITEMTDEERNEAMDDIENILKLYGITPESIDWDEIDIDNFDIEDYMKNR